MKKQSKTDDRKSHTDFWFKLPEDIKLLINQAKQELDRGEGIPHSQVMAEIKERFLKNK